MARIVDFEPDPELQGGYNFRRDDGSDLYAFGPDADALAQELERSRQPDARMAQAPQFAQQFAPPPQAQAGEYAQLLTGRQLQPEPAQAPPPAPPQELPPEHDPYMDPSLVYQRPSAGRAGGFIPATQQVKQSDASPYYGEVADVMGDISLERRQLHEELAGRESAQARAAELQAAAALPELEMRAAEAEAEKRAREDQYRRVRADVDDSIMAQRERRIDPNRWFSSKSTAGQISTTVSQMLGAFASLLTGGENFAAKQIDAAIERDIMSQEQEIRSGYADTENALQQMQLQYGDLETSKAALRMAMQDVAHMRAEEFAAATKSTTAMDAFRVWELDHLQKMAELEADLRTKAMGKVETTLATKYQAPQAPSSGGFRRATIGEYGKQAEALGKASVAEATIRGGGVSPDVLAKEEIGARTEQRKSARADVKELGKSLAETEVANRALTDAASEIGFRFNPESQQLEGMPSDIAGVGLFDKLKPNLAAGDKGRRVRQALENAYDLAFRARTGAAAPPAEAAKFATMIAGAGTEEEARYGLNLMLRGNESVRDMHRTRYGVDVVGQLERQRGELQSARESQNLEAEIKKY